jgi:Predicted kinase
VAGQTLTIPELSVVVLVGASGAGKSTFARRWFLPTEIVSSDFCRALIADDENDQAATPHAFEVLHTIVAKRLELGKLAVIDATNLYPEDRKRYLELAQAYHAIPVAIALALPASVCLERNATRTDTHAARGCDPPTGG